MTELKLPLNTDAYYVVWLTLQEHNGDGASCLSVVSNTALGSLVDLEMLPVHMKCLAILNN